LSLFAAGVVAALWVGGVSVATAWFREAHLDRPDTPVLAAPNEPDEDENDGKSDGGVGPDGVVGTLEIPRLAFREVVASGDDEATLRVAIGHLPDTALPWATGNSVLAGHRDTHFRALRSIVVGDVIRLKTRRGTFEYEVRDKLIVTPQDVWVMAPSAKRRITLVTCYPFSYVGPAPQRFIVRADAR
jgi:sortase A